MRTAGLLTIVGCGLGLAACAPTLTLTNDTGMEARVHVTTVRGPGLAYPSGPTSEFVKLPDGQSRAFTSRGSFRLDVLQPEGGWRVIESKRISRPATTDSLSLRLVRPQPGVITIDPVPGGVVVSDVTFARPDAAGRGVVPRDR